MDVVKQFVEIRNITRLSIAEAARQIGCNRGSLHQIEQSQRKCPEYLVARMVSFIDKHEPKTVQR